MANPGGPKKDTEVDIDKASLAELKASLLGLQELVHNAHTVKELEKMVETIDQLYSYNHQVANVASKEAALSGKTSELSEEQYRALIDINDDLIRLNRKAYELQEKMALLHGKPSTSNSANITQVNKSLDDLTHANHEKLRQYRDQLSTRLLGNATSAEPEDEQKVTQKTQKSPRRR